MSQCNSVPKSRLAKKKEGTKEFVKNNNFVTHTMCFTINSFQNRLTAALILCWERLYGGWSLMRSPSATADFMSVGASAVFLWHRRQTQASFQVKSHFIHAKSLCDDNSTAYLWDRRWSAFTATVTRRSRWQWNSYDWWGFISQRLWGRKARLFDLMFSQFVTL